MKNLIKVVLVVAGLSLSSSIVKAQQKFAHINSQELLQAMPDFKKADTDMEAWTTKKENELKAMGDEFKKKNDAFEALKLTVSAANQETVNKQLATMATELQDFDKRITDVQQKAQTEAKAKQDELYNPVITKATNAVNSVAKEKGIAYVFDTSQPSIIYFGGGEDLMAAVKLYLKIPATAAK